MKRSVALPFALLLCCGCSTTNIFSTYESDDLVAVQYNAETAYTLLVYRDQLGQTRHVLRRHGVCELVLTYTLVGDIALKERGARERKISVAEAHQVTRFINALLKVEGEGDEHPQSTRSI